MVEGYKGYIIVGSGIFDEVSQRYAPLASISWRTKDGMREIHVLDNSPKRYVDQDEAGMAALFEAKLWVDLLDISK